MMETKKIFSVFLARDLCRLGHRIIDIEYSKEEKKQVYVFEYSDKFDIDFGDIKSKFKNKKYI